MANWALPVVPTTAAQLGDLDYHVARVSGEILEQQHDVQEGTVVGGSYDPTTGSAEVLFGDTATIFGDDGPPGDAFINHQKLAILTTQPGDLYGPTGVERAICIPTPTGFGLLFKHYTDDSPQPPPGERWILHKTFATQTQPTAQYDGGAKFTNDGPTPGDGLGGSHFGYKGFWSSVGTNSGHLLSMDDTRQQVIAKTAGGHNLVFNDPNGTIAATTIGGHSLTFNDPLKTITTQTIGGMIDQFDDVTQTILRQPSANMFSSWNAQGLTITHQVTPGVFSLASGAPGAKFIQHQVTSGLQLVIDANGTITGIANAISHVVPSGGKISLGALAN